MYVSSDDTVTDTSAGGQAAVDFRFRTDGIERGERTFQADQDVGVWKYGSVAGEEIRFTTVSGAPATGSDTTGVWHAMSTERGVRVVRDGVSGPGTTQVVFDFEIRNSVGTIVATGRKTINATIP